MSLGDGVNKPGKLKVMTYVGNPGFRRSAALMFRYTTLNILSLVSAISLSADPFAGLIVSLISAVAVNSLPDIVQNIGPYDSRSFTEYVSWSIFHELAHASHQQATGNDIWDLWWGDYVTMLVNGNQYNKDSEIMSLVESWGFFYGNVLSDRKFGSGGLKNYINELDDYTRNYLYEGVFYDLLDGYNYKETWDNISGVSINSIFAPLKDKSIKSLKSYYSKFLEYYPFYPVSDVKLIFLSNSIKL